MQKKYILVTLANYIPVLCAFLLYRGGGLLFWSVFITMQVLLVCLNYSTAGKKTVLLFFSANLLVSTIIANWLSIYLYYTYISSDAETILVGYAAIKIGVVFVLILSLISLGIKTLVGRKNI